MPDVASAIAIAVAFNDDGDGDDDVDVDYDDNGTFNGETKTSDEPAKDSGVGISTSRRANV